MAKLKNTSLSYNFNDDDNSQQSNNFYNAIIEAQKIGQEIKNNPKSLINDIPKQSGLSNIAQLISTYMPLIQRMPYSPYVTPITSAAMGFYGSEQIAKEYADNMMEQIPFSQLSPNLAEAFPEIADLPSKKAIDILKSLNSYFANRYKNNAGTIGENDVNTVKSILKDRGYSGEDLDKISYSLIGKNFSILSKFPVKQKSEFNVEGDNVYGIPTRTKTLNARTGSVVLKDIIINKDLINKISSIREGKNAADIIYNKYYQLFDKNKRYDIANELNNENLNNKYDINEQGTVDNLKERIKNIFRRTLGKSGIKEQEVNALNSIIEAHIPKIARALGHTGVLTELDVLKSFGVMPATDRTAFESQKRQEMYYDIIKKNVETIIDRVEMVDDKKKKEIYEKTMKSIFPEENVSNIKSSNAKTNSSKKEISIYNKFGF